MNSSEKPSFARAPREDWDRGPWNRWTFQRVRELVPTSQVRRSSAPLAWSRAAQDLGELHFAIDGHRNSIQGFLAESFTDAFCIVHRGKIVCELYDNGMKEHTVHLLQSVSKSVTAATLGILVSQNRLRVDAPVTHYLPELGATAYRGATLQQVLDMTSGVCWDETYTTPDSHCAKMDVACGWKTSKDPSWPTCMWDLVMSLRDSRSAHGADFNYRSIETEVLALVMERATGTRLSDLVSEELWAPMGAEEDACFTVDSTGFACASGGLNATLRDLARFGQLYVSGGTVGGRQVVPEDWILQTRSGNPAQFRGTYREVLPNGAYRNQFWLEDTTRRVLLARGVFGQLIFMDTAADFVAVKLSSWPEFVNPTRTRTALAAIRAIRDSLA
jgi:CubicO group peptidase (beta-lactamase class C family)